MTDVTLARLTKAPNLSTTLPVTLSIGKVGNTEQSVMIVLIYRFGCRRRKSVGVDNPEGPKSV